MKTLIKTLIVALFLTSAAYAQTAEEIKAVQDNLKGKGLSLASDLTPTGTAGEFKINYVDNNKDTDGSYYYDVYSTTATVAADKSVALGIKTRVDKDHLTVTESCYVNKKGVTSSKVITVQDGNANQKYYLGQGFDITNSSKINSSGQLIVTVGSKDYEIVFDGDKFTFKAVE